MSIFGKIKDAIFGHSEKAVETTSESSDGGSSSAAQAVAPIANVDVEAILTSLAAKSGKPSNWKVSIVDLMTLLGLDSSLNNRVELAKELGYTGSTSDTATMNVWLIKQVMSELAKNGGKVPESLTR